jgi:hypothetical protein
MCICHTGTKSCCQCNHWKVIERPEKKAMHGWLKWVQIDDAHHPWWSGWPIYMCTCVIRSYLQVLVVGCCVTLTCAYCAVRLSGRAGADTARTKSGGTPFYLLLYACVVHARRTSIHANAELANDSGTGRPGAAPDQWPPCFPDDRKQTRAPKQTTINSGVVFCWEY